MAVDFRCEHCGKLLSIDAAPGSEANCPHCSKQVTVPEGLANLPKPQVPGSQPPPAAAQTQGQPDEEEFDEEEEDSEVMTTMAALMPWVLSVFFHAGLFLMMALLVLVIEAANEKKVGEDVRVNSEVFSDDPGGQINPGDSNPEKESAQEMETTSKQWARSESQVVSNADSTDTELTMIGLAGGGAAGGMLAKKGLSSGGSGAGPKGKFFGHGGNAHHIVYLIDRSGSMAMGGTFDTVCREMVKSISELNPVQTFHIVLFGDGTTIENPPESLVDATDDQKEAAVKFLEKQRASGPTDPIPAMNRAFDVLAKADRQKRGKIIFLLTDGVFTADNDEVLRTIKGRNRGQQVHINTYLYGGQQEKEAVDVMEKIAKENGGKFKIIKP
ncbi:MAG: VWA domain-containing protein [Planctomycetota bacterium]